MSTFDAIGQQTQKQQQQTGGGTAPLGAPTPAGPPTPGQETPAQGLPPTGIDQQLETLNQTYQAVSQIPGIGFDPNAQGAANNQTALPAVLAPGGQQPVGTTNVQQLSQQLAQQYGLAIGRGNLVDAQGNFLMTPQQLADASGDTLGEAATKMNFIGQAISRQQNQAQQQKGIAAIQTGLGQVQQRGRGSLASLQTGLYQDLADLYSNQEYQAADFSYFIQKEQQDIAISLQRRAEKKAEKSSMLGNILGGASIGAAFGPIGAAVGGVLGFAAGEWF